MNIAPDRNPIDQIINGNDAISNSGIETVIRYIQRDIADINIKLDDKYVTKDEFLPVRNVVYGLVGVILLSVIAAILAIVLRT